MTIENHRVEQGVFRGKAIPLIATLLGGVLMSGLIGITIAADKVLAPTGTAPTLSAPPAAHPAVVARSPRPAGFVSPVEAAPVPGSVSAVAILIPATQPARPAGSSATPLTQQLTVAATSETSAPDPKEPRPLRTSKKARKSVSGGKDFTTTQFLFAAASDSTDAKTKTKTKTKKGKAAGAGKRPKLHRGTHS